MYPGVPTTAVTFIWEEELSISRSKPKSAILGCVGAQKDREDQRVTRKGDEVWNKKEKGQTDANTNREVDE